MKKCASGEHIFKHMVGASILDISAILKQPISHTSKPVNSYMVNFHMPDKNPFLFVEPTHAKQTHT